MTHLFELADFEPISCTLFRFRGWANNIDRNSKNRLYNGVSSLVDRQDIQVEVAFVVGRGLLNH
jgi:hypothetical protein